MQVFIRNLRSDGYRFLHSALLPFHLLIPIFGAGSFLVYYTISLWDNAQKSQVYLQVIAMVFPFLVGMVVVIACEQELRAGSFQLLLSSPGKKQTPHLSKLCVLLLFGFFACLAAVWGFGAIFWVMGNTLFPLSLFFEAAVLLFFGSLPLYFLEYLLSFSFGKGIGLGFGMVGSLLSALLMTGLGDGIWPFLPWSVAAHCCMRLIECRMNGTFFLEVAGVKSGLLFLAVLSMVLLSGLIRWSKTWEGREEETD